MPTIKKRLNITLNQDLDQALTRLARRDHVSSSAKAGDLLRLALEIEEDRAWDALANARDTRGAKFISHKTAWA